MLAGQSQSFWLLSSLLAQLRDEGYIPADPTLFDKNIATLSASLASQTALSAGVSEFITSKCREPYLAHTSCPIAESVKRDLLVTPGTDSLLFNQPLLEKVVNTIKEDSLISSTASLASIPPLWISLALALQATVNAPFLHHAVLPTSVGVRVGA